MFQAEDGIRDIGVTGVQTCALPIFNKDGSSFSRLTSFHRLPTSATRFFTSIMEKSSNGSKIRTRQKLKDRKSTRLNSSHANISYAVFCLKKKKYENNSNQTLLLRIINTK